MNCFSAVSLLSLLPGCIQSVLRLPHNPSSIWGGEEEGVEETERPPDPVASHTTTLYTCSDNATYSMMPPIAKSPAALSGLRQENERAYIPDLASPHDIANQSATCTPDSSPLSDTIVELPDPSWAKPLLRAPSRIATPPKSSENIRRLKPDHGIWF